MRGLGSTFLRLEEAGGGFETEINREAAMMIRSTYHPGKKCREQAFCATPFLSVTRLTFSIIFGPFFQSPRS